MSAYRDFSIKRANITSQSLTSTNGLALIAVLLLIGFYLYRRQSTDLKLPPGPKPAPIVGNTFQVPTDKSWIYFNQLAKEYGPLVRLTLAGREVLILNELEDAEELLGKRSANYSNRQHSVYVGKYRSRERRLLLLQYGPLLRKQRAAVFQMINARVVGAYEHIQERGASKLLADLLKSPTNAYFSIKWYAAETLLTLVYGKPFGTEGAADLQALLSMMESLNEDFHPLAHMVDTFNVLDWLPDFLASWRIEARKKHEVEFAFFARLLSEVKQKMEDGEDLHCFAARLLEEKDKVELDDLSVVYLPATVFEAGTGNPSATALWALVAILLYPDTMRRAQTEIDSVLGTDGTTPPGFRHMEQLPYCMSFVKESLRWMPSAPIAPHASMKEDTYKGYYISAGTIVIPNIWAMHHDETRFPGSFTFNPDRHMPANGTTLGIDTLNVGHCGFGFGRRICPGQYLAAKMVWLAIVRLLWAFDVTPPLDANGKPILPDPDACSLGTSVEPAPFEVVLTPRSELHARTIRQAWGS